MDDALDRAVRVIADRIAALLRLFVEFPPVRHELLRDRVMRVGRIDQFGHRRRDGDGIAGGDVGERREPVMVRQIGVDQRG